MDAPETDSTKLAARPAPRSLDDWGTHSLTDQQRLGICWTV